MNDRRHRRFHLTLILMIIAAPGVSVGSAARRAIESDIVTGKAPFLEFINARSPGSPLFDVPRLAIGVGGLMREAVVDTGSTGVVMSASAIPDLDQLPSLGAGTITYSSSGRIMSGRWVVTSLIVAGRTGRVVTKAMPILAVDAIACTASARRCAPEHHPTHVAMLGIGFGREHDRQPGGTPDRNPLLNVAAPAGSSRSYVITRQGIRLGGTGESFTIVKLVRDDAHRDWFAPAACMVLGSGTRSCGTVLFDTGITGMFLTVPADRLPPGSDGRTLAEGTSVTIDLAPGQQGSTGYTVRAGDTGDAAAPSSITLAGIGRRPPFVNTGAHLLNRFDYLYDADAGLVGYRPIGAQSMDAR